MRLREPRARPPKAECPILTPGPRSLPPPSPKDCLVFGWRGGEGNRKRCSVIHALASPMKPRKVRILATSAHRMDGKSKATSGSVSASTLCSNSSHSSHHPQEKVQLFSSEFLVLPEWGESLPFSFA